MAKLKSIANKASNCAGTDANTGKQGCPIEFKTPLHAMLMKKEEVIDGTLDEFNLDFIRDKIQRRKYIPLIGAEDFEDMSSEDTMSTNQRGIERLSVKGLPKYKLTFEEGHQFYQQIAYLTSFKSFVLAVIDEEGQWKLVDDEGVYSGFSLGQVTPLMTKAKDLAGEAESKGISMQIIDREQWDKNYKIFSPDELGFRPEEIDGINSVELESLAALNDAGTTVEFAAYLEGDANFEIEDLVLEDILYTVNGVTTVATSLVKKVGAPGYDLTVPALATGETIEVRLFDSTKNVDVIDSNGVLYASNAMSETVVA